MLLEARGLGLDAGDRRLCTGLDLAMGSGETWAILGANGSGKTTLLHALAGLRAPDRGSVLLEGRDLRSLRPRAVARRRGLLLQDPEPGLAADVMQTVLTGRHPHLRAWGWETAADYRIAAAALAAMDLGAFAARPLATLSGGERRRVEIAALLAQDPPVCLLDEPTNHLDLRHQMQVLGLFAARSRRPGHLTVMVLHDVNLATRFCSHGLLLTAGGYRQGRLDEILDTAVLEQIYGCSFRLAGSAGDRMFIPA